MRGGGAAVAFSSERDDVGELAVRSAVAGHRDRLGGCGGGRAVAGGSAVDRPGAGRTLLDAGPDVPVAAERCVTARRAGIGVDGVAVVARLHAAPYDGVPADGRGARVRAGVGGDGVAVVAGLHSGQEEAVPADRRQTRIRAVV